MARDVEACSLIGVGLEVDVSRNVDSTPTFRSISLIELNASHDSSCLSDVGMATRPPSGRERHVRSGSRFTDYFVDFSTMPNWTRRFFCRPSSVVLGAMGFS